MSEQEIIAQYFSCHQPCATVEIGIGDDAAVVVPPDNAKLVITTDTLNAEVHFRSTCAPGHIGYKALAVNLSDLAAMGATPLWGTINLSLPKIDHDWLKGFSQGLFSLADQHTIKIIGGDLVKGPLSISIQVIGYLHSNRVLSRSTAQVDDLIYVSGTIGDASMGLRCNEIIKRMHLSNSEQEYITLRLDQPEARISLGLEIAKVANAAIDLSDGLLMDIQRIISMSKVGAIIDIEKIPVSKVMQQYLSNTNDWPTLVTGGEDYEICFTINKKYAEEVDSISEKTNCPITEIGKIVQNKGIQLVRAGQPVKMPKQLGFDHFI